LLDELSRASLPVAVASCGGRARVEHLLEKLRLNQYFRVVVTGDDVKEGKPDPTIFLRAASELKIRPDEALALEDSVSGVQAAKAAGMNCLGIADSTRSAELLHAGADHVVPDFCGVTLAKIHQLFS
jgi:beta-phosphoglucomutase